MVFRAHRNLYIGLGETYEKTQLTETPKSKTSTSRAEERKKRERRRIILSYYFFRIHHKQNPYKYTYQFFKNRYHPVL